MAHSGYADGCLCILGSQAIGLDAHPYRAIRCLLLRRAPFLPPCRDDFPTSAFLEYMLCFPSCVLSANPSIICMPSPITQERHSALLTPLAMASFNIPLSPPSPPDPRVVQMKERRRGEYCVSSESLRTVAKTRTYDISVETVRRDVECHPSLSSLSSAGFGRT